LSKGYVANNYLQCISKKQLLHPPELPPHLPDLLFVFSKITPESRNGMRIRVIIFCTYIPANHAPVSRNAIRVRCADCVSFIRRQYTAGTKKQVKIKISSVNPMLFNPFHSLIETSGSMRYRLSIFFLKSCFYPGRKNVISNQWFQNKYKLIKKQ